jgi:uncharacterized membrane protein YfcA
MGTVEQARRETARSLTVRGAVIGIVTGLFSGLSGVGGGALVVPLLTRFLRLPQHQAHGTSLAIIFPVAVAASVHHWSQGVSEWRLVGILAVSSAVGGVLGARMTAGLRAAHLRRLFGAFLLLVSVIMLVA